MNVLDIVITYLHVDVSRFDNIQNHITSIQIDLNELKYTFGSACPHTRYVSHRINVIINKRNISLCFRNCPGNFREHNM